MYVIFVQTAAPNILKVSVIIPLYNQRSFVGKAIDTALDQNETGEVIVVDDGSTDGGGDFVRQLSRNRSEIRVLSHPGNARKGVSASRNLAMDSARFPFLAFLDADDYMLQNRFARAYALFTRFPEAGAVAEALGYEDASKGVTMLTRIPEKGEMFFAMEPFGKSGHFSVCALTVRKEACEKTGFFDEELRIGEDTHWLARLTLTSEVVCGDLTRPVAIRRLHDSNTSLDQELAHRHKPLMALKLIRWSAVNQKGAEVRECLVKLFLKYHFESTHLFGQRARLNKKTRDLRAIFRLLAADSGVRHSKRFRYFVKTVFHWPIRDHLNYYK